MTVAAGFVPPLYPYDRLDELRVIAGGFEGGCVDLSVGTPSDPPPPAVVEALAGSDTERGYPPSRGSVAYREEAMGWLARRFGVDSTGVEVAGCVGTKEFVASLPHYLRLRDPSRDTVLYPAISYPTYAMGATLANCRAVPVPVDSRWCMDTGAIAPEDAARALCLWVNTPGNPAGGLDDLAAIARWGRAHRVPVFSDECYIEFTWAGGRSGTSGNPGGGGAASILHHGPEGVVAVHSLSKRSNLAGIRAGFYAGDPGLVGYLSEVRRHAGMMIPGPVQVAAVAAFNDDAHVEAQRFVYRSRLDRLRALFSAYDPDVSGPGGGLYLWVASVDGDGWGLARRVAGEMGALVSPGEFYGPAGAGHVRVAAVAPDVRINLLEQRMAARYGDTLSR
ncbi:aminotransferase class I/II-fold pyridoxal phosphate-dependent enzyme [Candidatus Poriferisocius sp.]|uniref:aminotransferase class I/II-fold pyridoxal phosphate-dependent enzyme n=1 Tax=Candidatus Poriferisocius sp. TaxID=3101276 RepID=UPI003B022038